MKVSFHKSFFDKAELKNLHFLLERNMNTAGDGYFSKKVSSYLENKLKVKKLLLTPSCTAALELATRLLTFNKGSEVVLPSFIFPSAANALLMHKNITIRFADIEENTLNIDPQSVLNNVSKRTKALILMHYGGIASDMKKIMEIASKSKFKVIEDAAQSIGAKYNDQYLGTIGHFGCYSFHSSKNIGCGEGGALCINVNDKNMIERAEIMREKGTNRSRFLRREVDKYTWVNWGSSYLLSDLLAAVLYAQSRKIEYIRNLRLKIFNYYYKNLTEYEKKGLLRLPLIPTYAKHNAHTFYLLFSSQKMRDHILKRLRMLGIEASFHYMPLHLSAVGKRLGYRKGDLPMTEKVSKTLLRLPLYAGLKQDQVDYTIHELNKILRKI